MAFKSNLDDILSRTSGSQTQSQTAITPTYGERANLVGALTSADESTAAKTKRTLMDIATREGLAEEALGRIKDGGVNFLKAVGRILNVGTATVAGAVSGAIREDENFLQGMGRGLKSNLTFSDVLRDDLGFKTETKKQRFNLGSAGLVLDIALDPLTYLTFGASGAMKAGGKILSKTGSGVAKKALQQGVSRNVVESFLDRVITKGGKLTREEQRIFQNLGVTSEVMEEAIGNAGRLQRLPGVYFAGARIPGTNVAATQVSRATDFARKLPGIKSIDDAYGKLFRADLGANSAATKLVREIQWMRGKELEDWGKTLESAFKGFSKKEMDEFSNLLLEKNVQVRQAANEALERFKIEFGREIDEPTAIALSKQIDAGDFTVPIKPVYLEKKVADLTPNQLEELMKDAVEQGLDRGQDFNLIQKVMRDRFNKAKPQILARQKKMIASAAAKRRQAKADLRGEKLIFDTGDTAKDARFRKATEILFEGRDGKAPLVGKMAAMAGVPKEEAIKFYFPFIFRDKVGRKGSKVGSLLRANKGFRKMSYGVQNENLIKNPIEAYARRSQDVVSQRIKTDSVTKLADTIGRHFDDDALAEAAGYAKFTFNGLDGRITTYLPEEVVADLKRWTKSDLDPIDNFFKAIGFDFMTSLFKRWVTSLFPAFHVRNMTSNQFLNTMENGVSILSPKNQLLAAEAVTASRLKGKAAERLRNQEITTALGEKIKMGKIIDEAERRGILNQGAMGVGLDDLMSTGRFVDGKVPQELRVANRFNPLSKDFALTNAGFEVGKSLENQSKLVSFIGNIRRGASYDDAWRSTERALFDYQNLTEFERKVMRRLIPFYAFAKKNIELQVRTLMRHPGRQAGQFKLINAAEEALGEPISAEEYEALPPWVQEQLGIKTGVTDEYGRPIFLTGLGLPIEAATDWLSGENNIFINLINNTLSNLNPVVKYPLEIATDRDFFRKKRIAEIQNASDLKLLIDSMPEPVAEEFKDLISYREIPGKPVYVEGQKVGEETKFTADPYWLHFFRNMFLSRVISTTRKATDLSGQPENYRWLNLFTGLSANTIDQAQQQYFNDLEDSEALMDYLDQLGLISKYDKFFEIDQDKSEFESGL